MGANSSHTSCGLHLHLKEPKFFTLFREETYLLDNCSYSTFIVHTSLQFYFDCNSFFIKKKKKILDILLIHLYYGCQWDLYIQT